MLHTRTVNMSVAALSSAEEDFVVVFDYNPGNLGVWTEHWDEPADYGGIEIVDVFENISDGFLKNIHGKSVYKLLSDDEENYLIELLWAIMEDE